MTDKGDIGRRVIRGLRHPIRMAKVLDRAFNHREVTQIHRRTEGGVVDWGLYLDGKRDQVHTDFVEAVKIAKTGPGAFVWIGLHEPDKAQFEQIARTFDLHELAVEDVLTGNQRPKVERYGDTYFVVFKTARYVEHDEIEATTEVVDTGEVMVFVGPYYAISVRRGGACRLAGARAGLESRPDLMRLGPWMVCHAIADLIVDNYLDVATSVEDDVEHLELSVFDPKSRADIAGIYQLKRELLEFKRAVVPMARPMERLVRNVGPSIDTIPEEVREYFRDVDDHLHKVIELVVGSDELVTSILEAHIAQISVQQNDDMRKISAWAAIGLVPTGVAGIYGMNFDHMPELHWLFGYPWALGLMLCACFILHRQFKKSGWL
ncbi:MAG: magnesium and cobalt transport protein CorA [Mycobacteriales bacterium]